MIFFLQNEFTEELITFEFTPKFEMLSFSWIVSDIRTQSYFDHDQTEMAPSWDVYADAEATGAFITNTPFLIHSTLLLITNITVIIKGKRVWAK